jgi:hypothetical protein
MRHDSCFCSLDSRSVWVCCHNAELREPVLGVGSTRDELISPRNVGFVEHHSARGAGILTLFPGLSLGESSSRQLALWPRKGLASFREVRFAGPIQF